MLDPSWNVTVIDSFRGAMTYYNVNEGDPSFASLAKNVEFREGGQTVRTRYGFGPIAGGLSGMSAHASSAYNWVSEIGNYLVWFTPTQGVYIADVSSPSMTPVLVIPFIDPSATHAHFAQNGNRLYVCFQNSAGRSTFAPRVITYNPNTSTFQYNTVMEQPLLTSQFTVSITQPSTGRITAGQHAIGVIFETVSGFIGRPSPAGVTNDPYAISFQPVTFTADGGKNCVITLTPTSPWPSHFLRAHFIVTTVSNRALYIFIPNGIVPVPANTTNPISLTWDFSDAELRVSARDDTELLASRNILLATHYTHPQTSQPTPPFTPYHIFPYGDRMCYLANLREPDGNLISTLLVSDRNHAERILLNRSIIRLSSQLPITTAFELNSQICILSPDSTFTTYDTGGDPVQWRIPVCRNNRIGTSAPRGVDVNSTEGYAIIASKLGLYPFDGYDYPNLPISHGQTNLWEQINWKFAHRLCVLNDIEQRIVYCLVPIGPDGELRLWAWSYKNFNPRNIIAWWKEVDFTEIEISGFTPNTLLMVLSTRPTNQFTYNQKELWLSPYSPSAPRRWYRKKSGQESDCWIDGSSDLSLFDPDYARPIRSVYSPGAIPPDPGVLRHMFHGVQIQGTGRGELNLSIIESIPEETDTTEPPYYTPLTLPTPPIGYQFHWAEYRGEQIFAECDLIAHKSRVVLSNNGAGSYFVLQALKVFHSPYAVGD